MCKKYRIRALKIKCQKQLTSIFCPAKLATLTQEEITMKMFNPETKAFKLFQALKQGEKVTAAEARKRWGISNIRAEASRIRQMGYAVYSNTRKANNGVVVTEYEMGRPSRRIVALGYKAQAMGLDL
jgi:hypothetical protein